MKWVNASVLDGGLNAIKTVATKMRLITAYAAGDSYATVLSNSICGAIMVSADFPLATSDFDNGHEVRQRHRQLEPAGRRHRHERDRHDAGQYGEILDRQRAA
jgi:hypothetical protein